MPDLADFVRWQWLWKSRRRLFIIGLAVFLLGLALLALLGALYIWRSPNTNIGRGIPAPVILMAMGGYAMLQATFSGSGAFGDHDDQPLPKTLPAVPRSRRRKGQDVGDRPIPLADTTEAQPLKVIPCPVCLERVTVASDADVECAKCLQRFKAN